MKAQERSIERLEAEGIEPLADPRAARVQGGARIHIPIGVDADGNVIWEWVEI